MNELIRDFEEYSTDFTKTACTYYANYLREYQKEKLDLQQRIDDATERLNALIVFWKKYNPIDNTMQVEQFKGVIEILGGKE